MVNSILLLWALVGLIGGVHGKCSIASIVDNDRSIAYACELHGKLGDLDQLPSDTEWIEFSVSRFHAIPDDAFRRFPNLRRLSFYNCHINAIEPAAFRGLNRLDWLIFRGTKIHAVRSVWFRHLPNLRRLVLDRCGLVHVEPGVFRMLLPRLETLDLRDNDLDCLSVEELSHLTALRTVRIDGNPWLCECRLRMERFFRERSIVQEIECRFRPRICTVHRNPQCMAQIEIPLPVMTIEPIKTLEKFQIYVKPSAKKYRELLKSTDRLAQSGVTCSRIESTDIPAVRQYCYSSRRYVVFFEVSHFKESHRASRDEAETPRS